MKNKASFFERLTGGVNTEDEMDEVVQDDEVMETESNGNGWMEESNGEGELAIDMYQTPDEIIVKAMIAGVDADDLDVDITRDMVTIKGSRSEERIVDEEDYHHQELYWGSFSRTVLLPQEIEPEEAEAEEKNGLLTITLPKIDKKKVAKLRVKSK